MKTTDALMIGYLLPALAAIAPAQDAALQRILDGGAPQDVAELRSMQAHVQAMLERVLPATVSLPGATGVLVDGGFVLTAGHVIRESGRRMKITLEDGRELDGVTLGANMRSDTGLVRVLTEGDFPTCEMGSSSDLNIGEWCVMLGHASGDKPGRSAPARLGRVLDVPAEGFLVTDCTMQSGDSGGPLVDMDGRVIGINSRISQNLAHNMHVPIDAFHAEWEKLVASEVVQMPRRGGRGTTLGLRLLRGDELRVREIVANSRAEEGGLEAGDVILKIDGTPVSDRREYSRALRERTGDEVVFEVRRGDQTLELTVQMQRGRP